MRVSKASIIINSGGLDQSILDQNRLCVALMRGAVAEAARYGMRIHVTGSSTLNGARRLNAPQPSHRKGGPTGD
jgi:hypothetical protein